MTQPENPDLEIEIDTDEQNKTITLKFQSKDREIIIGFAMEEAQQLSVALNEAVTLMLMKNGFEPETRH